MKKVNVTPNTILLNSLRDVGYTETMAICDIIDNSIDAKAKNVAIKVISIKDKVTEISITDDGIGMDRNALIQALTLGSNVTRSGNSLGHYGMGLKTAGLALATEIDILTKKNLKSGGYLGIFDLDYMLTSNSFDISIGKHTKKSCGTIITLKNVDKLTSTTAKTYIKVLKEKIAEVFTKILSNINITINGIKIIADDIFLENLSTNYNVDAQGILQSPYKIKFDINGKSIYKNVKIDLWKMPINSTPTEKYSQKSQGFYVFRNKRLIASHLDLGIYTKTAEMNQFRGAVYFDNMDDVKDAIGLNFSKQGVNFNDALVKELSWHLTDALDRIRKDLRVERAKLSIKNNAFEDFFSRQLSKLFKRGINWSLGTLNGQKALANVGGSYVPPPILPKVKILKSNNITSKPVMVPVKVKNLKASNKRKPPKSNTPSNNIKNNLTAGANTSVIIEKLPLGKNDIFWKFEDMTNGAVKIVLNVDHDYYQKEYMNSSKDVKEAILKGFIITGRGVIEANLVSDDREQSLNDMFNNFGDDYRHLV